MRIELNKLLKFIQQTNNKFKPHYGGLLDEPLAGYILMMLQKLYKMPTEDSKWAASTVVRQYIGQVFSKELLIAIICRVFSARPEILAGLPPTLWTGTCTKAVMQCTGVALITAPAKAKPMLKVYMRCLIGEPAGLHFSVNLSRSYMEYMLSKQLGLSYRKYNLPAEHFTGCFFTCMVEEDTTGAHISNIEATEAMKGLNKKLAEKRLSLHKCMTGNLDCAYCTKTRKDCKLAVWK